MRIHIQLRVRFLDRVVTKAFTEEFPSHLSVSVYLFGLLGFSVCFVV